MTESPAPSHSAADPTAEYRPVTDPTAAYLAGLRNGRRRYAAVIVTVVLALLVTVIVAWNHGENAHVHLHTVSQAPPTVAMGDLSPAPATRWRTTDTAAIGAPYWVGSLVTYSAHTVNGRNLSTGAVTWSYTRTDRTVCQVIQDEGIVVAIYRLAGACDEVTALDAQSGKRRWERTLDQDTDLVTSNPTYSIAQYTFLVTTNAVVYAIDPVSGLDRWTFSQPTCTIHGAVIGTQGALISQTCAKPDCSGIKFCKAGDQLLLRDPNNGRVDDTTKAAGNPDQIKWNLFGDTDVPVSADAVIAAASRTGTSLSELSLLDGKLTRTVAMTGSSPRSEEVDAYATLHDEFLWVGGVSYVLDAATGAPVFSVASTGPLTVTASSGTNASNIDLPGARILAANGQGVAVIDPGSGQATTTFPVPAPVAGASAYAVGTGFLIAGPVGPTSVYQ